MNLSSIEVRDTESQAVGPQCRYCMTGERIASIHDTSVRALGHVLSGAPLEESLAMVCDAVVDAFDGTTCWISVTSATGSHILSGDRSDSWRSLHLAQASDQADAWHRQFGASESAEATSMLSAPIVSSNVNRGAIHIHHDTTHPALAIPAVLETTSRLLGSLLSIEARSHELHLHSVALGTAASVVVVTDPNGIIEWANEAFSRVTGFDRQAVVGQHTRILNSGQNAPDVYADLWKTISAGRSWVGELVNRRKSGEVYLARQTISPVVQADGVITHYIAVQEDITERSNAESLVQFLSGHDVLTGLANRNELVTRAGEAIAHARGRHDKCAIMLVDIHRFRTINETLGHAVGDRVLGVVARRLERSVLDAGLVARLGGDLFAILLRDAVSATHAAQMASRIGASLREPLGFGGSDLVIEPSLGIALAPDDAEEAVDLLRCAETALHRAKRKASRKVEFYSAEMNDKTRRRMMIELRLRRAVQNHELSLHFQPQVSLNEGRYVGTEALLRWDAPGIGSISPAEFIPIAEDTGTIEELGEWVLEEACRQLWDADVPSLPGTRVAINVSARQIESASIAEVARTLTDNHRGLPSRIELEITETAMRTDPDHARDVLSALKGMGFAISIDDFGTGYSSFGYLRRLPLDALKIDQSFVREVTVHKDDAAITGAIIAMAHKLGLLVVAEGVETNEQARFLVDNQCDIAQGYYFGVPCTRNDLTRVMDEAMSRWRA